eukprot:gene38100-46295_t
MTDSATSTKLALIYSRLAELELQKERRGDVWDAIVKKFDSSHLDTAEIHNIEDIFFDALYGADRNTSEVPRVIDGEGVSRVRLLFLAEQQFSEALHKAISDKLNKVKAFRSERDGKAADMFRVREDLLRQDNRLRDVEELCRSLQKLCKEKDEQRVTMIQQEREKTQHLERECVQSIESVNKKIAEEEKDLELKALENEQLETKLEQFSQHLQLRREKMQNEAKAKELRAQLEGARKAQNDYNKAQDRLRRESIKSKVRHLEEAVHALQQQLSIYGGKFDEFDDTLNKSFSILKKVDERVDTLDTMVQKLSAENEFLKAQVSEADVSFIRAVETKKLLEGDLAGLQAMHEKLDRKVRKLLSKRQELAKKVAVEGAGSAGAAVSSTSSSSSVSTGMKAGEGEAGTGTPLTKMPPAAVGAIEDAPSSLPLLPVAPAAASTSAAPPRAPSPRVPSPSLAAAAAAPSSSSSASLPGTPSRKNRGADALRGAPPSSSMSSPSRGAKAGGESE